MKLFLKKLILIAMVLVLSAGRGVVQVTALTTYTGDVFGLHIDTNGSNNQGGGLGIYECHYLDQPVSTVNDQGWNLTEGVDAQTIVNYYSSHYTCVGHTPIVGELVDGKYFTGFIVYHVTYWNNGDLKFVGIQAAYSLTPPNHAPVANNQAVSTPEDVAKAITLTGSDADSNPLTYTVLSLPLHGTLSGTAPNLTYTPTADYNGPDSFTFKVNDGTVDSGPATVSIAVGPVNDVPTANNQSVSTNEDVALAIILTGSDPEGDSLTYEVLTQPGHGVLVGSGSSWTYTPVSNYFGPDIFTFKVNDGHDDSNVATISITVISVNDAPIADNQNVSTDEDVAKAITLTGSDPDGDDITYSIVTGPTNGGLAGSGSSWVYTPNTDYIGTDSFTFRVYDGALYSTEATVTITIGGVNDAPTAYDQSVSLDEDTNLDITLMGSDPEESILVYTVLTQPAHGELTGTGASLNYKPYPNYFGPDRFTFKVSDGTADSNIAEVLITVDSINDAPVADDQTVTTLEDTPKDIILTGSDIDGDPITFEIKSNPMFGTLEFVTDHWVYTPYPNYNGADSFTFVVNDGFVDSVLATVNINVTSVNDAPVADDSSFDVDEGGEYEGEVSASDPDFMLLLNSVLPASPLMLTYILVDGPTYGSLIFNPDGTYTYTHFGNESTSDFFTFKAFDGELYSNVATVMITINPINDAPTADDQLLSTLEDTPKNIVLTGSDVDGDLLTFDTKSGPLFGTLDFVVDHWVYTPNPGFNGTDSFTFVVNDGLLDSELATVTIVVTDVNDAPIADDSSFDVDEGGQYDGEVTATDPDFGMVPADVLLANPLMLTYTLVGGPANGSLTFNPDGTYTYIHNGSETISDSFTFKSFDGELYSNVAMVSITINPINDLPVANNSAFTILIDAIFNGALSALDPEGNPLIFELVVGPTRGTLILQTNGTYAYDHDGLSILPDSFTFKVSDGQGYSNTATVSITVTPLPIINRAPIGFPEAFTVVEGGSTDGLVTGADADGDPILFFLMEDVKNGTLTFAANGAYTYTHNNTETTTDSFRFRVWDGRVYSPILTAAITVTPVNEAPVAVNGTDETDFETALSGNIHGLASDIDSADWTLGVVSTTTHGTLVLNANGSFTYTPNTGFSGIDVFTFKANDGALDSNVAIYTITINEDVIIIEPETPLSPLSFWWAYLLGLLLLLLFFLRPNLKYALVDKNGNEKVIRRHVFANGKDDLFIDLNDKNVEGLVAVDLVVYKQLVKREQGHKITFNLFKKPMKTISVPEDMKEKIEDQIKL